MQHRCGRVVLPVRAVAGAILIASAPAAAGQSLIGFLTDYDGFDEYGDDLALIEDVDGDGVDDIAVGNKSLEDNVRVISGASQAPLHLLKGGWDDEFGRSIASLGDIDGDGRGDLAVGAQGRATAFSGASGSVLYTFLSPGPQDVGGGGDATGDGVNDMLVGGDDTLRLYDGATGALVRTHTAGLGPCSNFGNSPTFLGDVNADGFDDYAAGAPGELSCGASTGVFVFDGASGIQLWSDLASPEDELGWALEAYDDVDGDGAPELLVSAKQEPGVGCTSCNGKGFVRLLDGATGTIVWQVDGATPHLGLGYDLARVGDVDGDGLTDFAAGQPGSLSGEADPPQPVQVRAGSDGALLFEVHWTDVNVWTGVGFGCSLDSGDFKGDGWRDLMVGVPFASSLSAGKIGIVEVFTIDEPVASYCTAKVNSQGCAPAMSWTGVPTLWVSPSTFQVHASHVLNQQNGILIWSYAPAAQPFQGGTLCIGGSIQRTGPQSSGGNPPPDDCSGSFSFAFTTGHMLLGGIEVGDMVHCQYWYRDPGSTPASGLTDAVQFLVLH